MSFAVGLRNVMLAGPHAGPSLGGADALSGESLSVPQREISRIKETLDGPKPRYVLPPFVAHDPESLTRAGYMKRVKRLQKILDDAEGKHRPATPRTARIQAFLRSLGKSLAGSAPEAGRKSGDV